MSANDTQEAREERRARLSETEEEQRPEAFDSENEQGKVLERIAKLTDPDRTIRRQRT